MFDQGDDGLGCPRGIVIGLPLALVLWVVFYWLLSWSIGGVRGWLWG